MTTTEIPTDNSGRHEARPRAELVTIDGAASVIQAMTTADKSWCNRREHIMDVLWETAWAIKAPVVDASETTDEQMDQANEALVDLVNEARQTALRPFFRGSRRGHDEHLGRGFVTQPPATRTAVLVVRGADQAAEGHLPSRLRAEGGHGPAARAGRTAQAAHRLAAAARP